MAATGDVIPSSSIKFKEHEFLLLNDHAVLMVFIGMTGGSFLVWIGEPTSHPKFSNLALSLATNSTSLIGHNELVSQTLSKKLSIKLNNNKPTYVSYNYPDVKFQNDQLLVEIDKTAIEFVTECKRKRGKPAY
ncbi:hypothetical protein HDE_00041 [Halotydeus destructor]|nr:hypothetical protein HDE_00041 [Halotydeus destructor]